MFCHSNLPVSTGFKVNAIIIYVMPSKDLPALSDNANNAPSSLQDSDVSPAFLLYLDPDSELLILHQMMSNQFLKQLQLPMLKFSDRRKLCLSM